MPQYVDRMTRDEVRACIRDLERTIRLKRRNKTWSPDEWIIFAPKQVIDTLRAEGGGSPHERTRIELLGEYFTARAGAMPDLRRKFGYVHRS